MEKQENKKIEKKNKKNWFQKQALEFRKIRWTNWPDTRKSFFITVLSLLFMSLLFFGITIGITELFKITGII